MLGFLVFQVWKWNRLTGGLAIGTFLLVDGLYFASNITKIPDGGWFPLVVAAVGFIILTTWATGRALLRKSVEEGSVPIGVFVKSAQSAFRAKGTAVFLSSSTQGVPSALLHNLKHNQVVHERVIVLTVKVEDVPHVDLANRSEVIDIGSGFYRVVLHYGFMEEVDIPVDLQRIRDAGGSFNMMSTSFFLGRQKLIASREKPGMALWRERLFAWMLKSSESAMESFRLPTNRVVELGSQVQI
jgi:KUP system potassium uptake protein